jgi:hypothetical protein
VLGDDVVVLRSTAQLGHGVRGGDERLGADHRRRYAGLLEQHPVGDGRCARRAAVPDADDDDVAAAAVLRDDGLALRQREGRLPLGQGDGGRAVLGHQQVADVAEQQVGVALAVVQQAHARPGEVRTAAGEAGEVQLLGKPEAGAAGRIDDLVRHRDLLPGAEASEGSRAWPARHSWTITPRMFLPSTRSRYASFTSSSAYRRVMSSSILRSPER